MLNNQPMGFYAPAILIKDAQRHGLRVLPVDVAESDWECTVGWCGPPGLPSCCLRLGLRYARGLREEAARAILEARPFGSIDDLALRVPQLRKDEINRLAEIGALNSLNGIHRRDALWQAQRAVRPVGPLLASLEETGGPSPLAPMNTEERLRADYRGAGLSIGKHPMAYRREEMNALGVTRAIDLAQTPNGRLVRIAGSVIVRQRPGTAKGFVFLSMEDETGIMNAIVAPPTYDRYKLALLTEPFLMVFGVLQNLDGVISVKAARVEPLHAGAAAESHDFH
jgi:error-prone DNA polymerase